ncbi:NUDIX hydrolase domain-like protein [Zopfochytrium polystomum]|nr:NUDIX hydrolase domain-like protein [Zopfochytrium polystomum]
MSSSPPPVSSSSGPRADRTPPPPPPLPSTADAAAAAAAVARLAALPPHADDLLMHPDRRAAVLVGLFQNPVSGKLEVLLTVRSATLRTHGGEVALPGGRKDPSDNDLVATALREAHEEVSLAAGRVRVLGVVGSVDEVARTFWVPLDEFLSARRHRAMAFPMRVVSPSKEKAAAGGGSPAAKLGMPEGETAEEGGTVVWRGHGFDWEISDSEDDGDDDVAGDQGEINQHAGSTRRRVRQDGSTELVFGLTAAILIRVAVAAFGREPEFEVVPDTLRPQMSGPRAGLGASSAEGSAAAMPTGVSAVASVTVPPAAGGAVGSPPRNNKI